MRLALILTCDRPRTRATVVAGPMAYSAAYQEFLTRKRSAPETAEEPLLLLVDVVPSLLAVLRPETVAEPVEEPVRKRRRNPADGQ
jgi:hypothetical protein